MVFARLLTGLNLVANAVGRTALSPLSVLPEWLGAVLVAVVTGAALLLIFKWTSNQPAIRDVRNRIRAELLAQSLFHDDLLVTLQSQFSLIRHALRWMSLALVPMLVMFVPVCLFMVQLSLWWQARPLRVNDQAVITVNLAGDASAEWPEVKLEADSAFETLLGPVRIRTQRALCWAIRAKTPGYHHLVFDVNGQKVTKDLSIGSGLMRVSPRRSGTKLIDLIVDPAESPFDDRSAVKTIEIQYPTSNSWMTGRDSWLYFWFAASTISALTLSRLFRVHV